MISILSIEKSSSFKKIYWAGAENIVFVGLYGLFFLAHLSRRLMASL